MLSFPANPINGQQYTDQNGKVWLFDGTKWDFQINSAIKQFYGTKVSLSTDVFLTSTLSAVAWDTEEIDTAQFFNSSTPTKIIIPRTGYYRIHMVINSGQEGNGTSYVVQLKRNTTTIFEETMAAYQSGEYDIIVLLNTGDELVLYASEENTIGRLIEGTFAEIQLVGYSFGGAIIPGFEFSGVKAELQNQISVSSTENTLEWNTSDIVFNANADSIGNIYWDGAEPTKFIIRTSGYYRIRSFILTGVNGSADTYNITIKKNGTTDIEFITLGANESAELDETYYLQENDYIQIKYSNTENIGTIEAGDTYFELTRLGV